MTFKIIMIIIEILLIFIYTIFNRWLKTQILYILFIVSIISFLLLGVNYYISLLFFTWAFIVLTFPLSYIYTFFTKIFYNIKSDITWTELNTWLEFKSTTNLKSDIIKKDIKVFLIDYKKSWLLISTIIAILNLFLLLSTIFINNT